MAGVAVGGDILPALVGVTARAADFLVIPFELEFRLLVIKTILAPARFVMTVLTFLSQITFVGIAFLVTVNALAAGIAIFLFRLMAAYAAHLGMITLEWEVGLAVVEELRIQMDDFRASALVVGVTTAALGGGQLGTEAVVSLFLVEIGSDFLMAIETEIPLRVLLEAGMALLALILVFGMPLDHSTGHHQALERRGHNGRSPKTQGQKEKQDGYDDALHFRVPQNQNICTATTWTRTATVMSRNKGI